MAKNYLKTRHYSDEIKENHGVIYFEPVTPRLKLQIVTVTATRPIISLYCLLDRTFL